MNYNSPPKRTWLRLAGLAVTALAAAAPPAHGQSIDYGALQNLFGEPVTTSATGTPLRVSEVPVTMDIISADDIRRSGATDIPGVLTHLAGIDVLRISPSQAEVAVRGYAQPLTDSRLLVLINGRQVFSNVFSSVIWSTIPVQLDEIRQIEVVKGPNSALYGFNAAAGVINIITYNPLYDDVNSVRLRGGTDNYGEASAITGLHNGKAGLRLSASGLTEADPKPVTWWTPVDPASRTDTVRGMVNVDGMIQASDQTQIRLEANYLHDQGRYFGFLIPLHVDIEAASAKLQVVAETGLGLVDASLTQDHSFAKELTFVDPEQTVFQEETTILSVQDLFKLGINNSFRVNGEYRHSEVPSFIAKGGNLTADIGSLGTNWDRNLGGGVALLSAARFDAFKLARSGGFITGIPYTNSDYDRLLLAWSVNEAISWRATPVDTLRASVARGLQLPSLGEYGTMTAGPSPVTATYGNPQLNPSTVLDAELSYDRLLPSLDASLRATVFHQQTNHLRGWTQPQMNAQFQIVEYVEELGQSATTGIETGLKGHVGPQWSWEGNLTWQIIKDKINPDNQGVNFTNGTPHIKVNARLGYADDPWELDLWGSYVTSTAMPVDTPGNFTTLGTVSSYVTVMPRVAYRLTPWATIDAVGQLPWSYHDNPISPVERRGMMSLQVRY